MFDCFYILSSNGGECNAKEILGKRIISLLLLYTTSPMSIAQFSPSCHQRTLDAPSPSCMLPKVVQARAEKIHPFSSQLNQADNYFQIKQKKGINGRLTERMNTADPLLAQ